MQSLTELYEIKLFIKKLNLRHTGCNGRRTVPRKRNTESNPTYLKEHKKKFKTQRNESHCLSGKGEKSLCLFVIKNQA